MHSVYRIEEIKSGRMRWTVQAVCMENKQDIKHKKVHNLGTPGYKQGEKQLVGLVQWQVFVKTV